MSVVLSIGAYLYKKNGPEGLTLFQLAQAEDEGLWSDRPDMDCPAEVIDFNEARSEIYSKCQNEFMSIWTQMRHTQ